ncbi:uncharacterized protein TRIADDRAFT_59485 [Trichoplax adhaerens]|uniref:Methyltransferase domain-containing protein n=1 Tax=Trichoplax adhaerens TaxID=10228 RepID=B3S5V2_TRIAD|nr:predicted protein [Trichoplax adhaerens]EDV21964.1 predicted protein [Trichoplax adhaerens]|eukprot:XP_002115601.1 predicted protein [Trichoplax adhaerens]
MEKTTIKTHVFEYNRAFSAYKNASNEIEIEARLHQALINGLKEKGLVNCHQDDPIRIADICCGAGDRIVKYLRNIQFQSGIDLIAVDSNPDYTGLTDNDSVDHKQDCEKLNSTNGIAGDNLYKAMQAKIIPLNNYRVLHADVMKCDITRLLLGSQTGDHCVKDFKLVYLLQCGYYFISSHHDQARFKELLDKICSDLLSSDGIAVLSHSCLEPNTHVSLFNYATGKTKSLIPTPKECLDLSVHTSVTNLCDNLGLSCFDIPYTAYLQLSPQVHEYKEIFKDPKRYCELDNKPDALTDFYTFLFIYDRSLDDLYCDKSSRGLSAMIDNTFDIIDSNNRIPIPGVLQVILNRAASVDDKTHVDELVQELANH